jgi:competence protein ComFC
MWILDYILETIFPSTCYLCKQGNLPLCTECIKKFPPSITSPYEWIYSSYHYKNNAIKKVLHAFKYYNKRILGITLVQTLNQDHLLSWIHNTQDTYLVAVPTPKVRAYMRGSDHTKTLAKAYSKLLGIPVLEDSLLRKKTPSRQVTKHSRNDRLKNQKHTFILKDKNTVYNKNLILVDDITTTGATLYEARTLLLQDGARSVRAITLAH